MQRADIRYPIIAVRHIAVMVVVNCAFAALFDRFVTTWIGDHVTSPDLVRAVHPTTLSFPRVPLNRAARSL